MYTFFEKGDISPKDLERLIELTDNGVLKWRASNTAYSLIGEPVSREGLNSQQASAKTVGANLRGIYLSYTPSTHKWHFLRLTNDGGARHYVEEGAPAELMELTDRLYEQARKAVRLGGLLASENDVILACRECSAETPHRHLVDRPYGLAGAVMAGSERLTCIVCENSVPPSALPQEQ